MPQNRRRHAFTLTELLIAIGIIVILIGLLLPAITRIRKAAYTASTQQQISALTSAIEAYHNDFNAYPGPLPEAQIFMAVNTTGGPTYTTPYLIDLNGKEQDLGIVAGGPASGFTPKQITGAQNLVLGLLGGLGFSTSATPEFFYDPTVIYPSTAGTKIPGNTPAASGPASLSTLGTHQASHSYITVQASDLYNPFDGTNLHPFTDSAQRMAGDAGIPVFLDKYPDAMPILYMRASRGAAAVVTLNGNDGTGSPPKDSSNNPVTAQYDLVDVVGYTTPPPYTTPSTTPGKGIGASVPYYHGLQNVWTGKPDSPLIHPTNASNTFEPLDAWAYLRNPDLGPPIPPAGSPPTTDLGVPRQKDTYILISAGPDRTYGTNDDVTNFGTIAP